MCICENIAHAENERVYCARPSELLYGELLQRYIASAVLSVYLQTSQAIRPLGPEHLLLQFLQFEVLFSDLLENDYVLRSSCTTAC